MSLTIMNMVELTIGSFSESATLERKNKMCRIIKTHWRIFMSRRQRRTYSKEFKQHVVDLYLAGKPRVEIIREHELTPSSFDKWVKQTHSTESFKKKIP